MAVKRLVQLVRYARRHLTHGDQAAGRLGPLGLHGGLLLGVAARGDIAGNHHLRQTAIGPAQVARAHFQPFVQTWNVDLGVFALRHRELAHGQAYQHIYIVVSLAARGVGSAGLGY